MLSHLKARPTAKTIPLVPMRERDLAANLAKLGKTAQRWAKEQRFRAKHGQVLAIPGRDGSIARVLCGLGDGCFTWSNVAARLPPGRYAIEGELPAESANDAALGWALACYTFTRYKPSKQRLPDLVWPEHADRALVSRLATGIALARDLITTPANDMGPTELSQAAKELAELHGAEFRVIVGDDLLEEGYPAIHAVGRASDDEPRLIDIVWGDRTHPKLALVGKGVCFDTGGLDIKLAPGMKLMKKDMGGAATLLGLAHAIMDAKLPVYLRVLIPAVENSVSGSAMRPLDVLSTRKGLTVEVGNTDAEGRLVLADALAEAASHEPALIIDMATLTGAARVALGAELPVLFSNNDGVANALLQAGTDTRDPLWRLPLHRPYRRHIESRVADLNNIANTPFGGAITAALFLEEFVGRQTPWIHIDTMAYNMENRPGRPVGGEAFALRALYTYLERRFGA